MSKVKEYVLTLRYQESKGGVHYSNSSKKLTERATNKRLLILMSLTSFSYFLIPQHMLIMSDTDVAFVIQYLSIYLLDFISRWGFETYT